MAVGGGDDAVGVGDVGRLHPVAGQRQGTHLAVAAARYAVQDCVARVGEPGAVTEQGDVVDEVPGFFGQLLRGQEAYGLLPIVMPSGSQPSGSGWGA
ncbi:hypothetical protein GCM10022403_097670 [Streptomyces coacervatus]|uniref:Uncharacterized protein n=1 Tax=Streptomyces coacervatus TaxID=647381 RepID=A0ABP7JQ27_9ACTN